MSHVTTYFVSAVLVAVLMIMSAHADGYGASADVGAPAPSASLDSDCDGLTDAEELAMGGGLDPHQADSDGDDILDGVELGRRGSSDPVCALTPGDADPNEVTDPNDADSDHDGIRDGDEDVNHNGRRDPGETSAADRDTDHDGTPDGMERALGMDPLVRDDVPRVPEPLLFDLARGLGAHRGELEANVVTTLATSAKGSTFAWHPEIEYAYARGHALELELPIHGTSLQGVKLSAQGTAGTALGRTAIHGWQLSGQVGFDRRIGGHAVYVFGLRATRAVSALVMAGAQLEPEHREVRAVVNPSLFYDFGGALTVGLENNVAVGPNGAASWLALPQVHVARGHVQLQAGTGVRLTAGEPVALVSALRFVVNL